MACYEELASFNEVQESCLADLTVRLRADKLRLAERSEKPKARGPAHKLPRTSGNVERAALAAIAAAVAPEPPPAPGASFLANAIGWDQAPHRLQTVDLADLDPTLARAIRDLAGRAEVIDLAKKLALDPLLLVIGLLARKQADRNRSAARIARAIFGKRPRREVDEAAATLGVQ